jgi:hypothetical protein
MRLALAVLLVVACKKDPSAAVEPVLTQVPDRPAAPAAPAPPAAPEAPLGVDAMVQALSSKDRGPTCLEVEALAEAPVEALLHIVEHVPLPPQAPMRAATCLVDRHADAVQDELLTWVKQEETKGLGKLVLQRLDTLPEPIAVDVARVAVTGPLADDAVEAARASTREAVRAAAP